MIPQRDRPPAVMALPRQRFTTGWEAKLSGRLREPASAALRTAVGFPTTVRLNRMGRRFSGHGPLDCQCARVSHTLSTIGRRLAAISFVARRPSTPAFLPSLHRAFALRRRSVTVCYEHPSPQQGAFRVMEQLWWRHTRRCSASSQAVLGERRAKVGFADRVTLRGRPFDLPHQHVIVLHQASLTLLHHRMALSADGFISRSLHRIVRK